MTKFEFQKSFSIRSRLFLLFFSSAGIFAILFFRLVSLQVYRTDFFSGLADRSRRAHIKLEPDRGMIYDRNMYPLALNIYTESVYAVPRAINDKALIAANLKETLSLDSAFLEDRLSGDSAFAWVKRKVSPEEADSVRDLNMNAVGFLKENRRVYPNGETASHILGFVDIDNIGLEGLEAIYDGALSGEGGYRTATVDARRRQIRVWEEDYLPERDGFDLILTLDIVIQHIAEEALHKVVEKYHPISASVVVMDPVKGDLLAMANTPTYDPGKAGTYDPDERRNRAVTDIFEPGSSFKVVTACAALEEGLVELEEEIYCENGAYRVGGRVLHDHHAHADLSFTDVISKSSNIGTVKVAERLGEERLYGYIRRFGFGEKTGVDLQGEINGLLSPVSKWSKASITSIPMGQEIGVTVLQLAQAVSIIANGGIFVRPHIMTELRDANGITVKEHIPDAQDRVISSEVSEKMKFLMKHVVDDGTGKRAGLRDYTTAGKTGTAQRLEDDGSYSHRKFNSVFIGFAPVSDPKLAIAVLVVEPKGQYYGGTVAAPVFAEITDKSLKYMGVAPDKI